MSKTTKLHKINYSTITNPSKLIFNKEYESLNNPEFPSIIHTYYQYSSTHNETPLPSSNVFHYIIFLITPEKSYYTIFTTPTFKYQEYLNQYLNNHENQLNLIYKNKDFSYLNHFHFKEYTYNTPIPELDFQTLE